MNKEVQEFLKDLLDDLKNEVKDMRSQMETEHKKLWEEVIILKQEAKVTRWIFGGTGTLLGAIVTLVAREIIVKYL